MRNEIDALKEIRDRISYFCSRTDGKYGRRVGLSQVEMIRSAINTLKDEPEGGAK